MSSGPVPRSLRVSREPCRFITDEEIHASLSADPASYVEFIKQMVGALADGRARVTLPPKQVFADASTGGDFRVMPCELRHGERHFKTVKVIGTNTIQRAVPDQITVGKMLVLDPRENFVCAILDGCLLSSARTGACAALAIEILAPARERLVIVGAGRVGFYAALYAISACGVREVTFCDSIPERACEAAGWFRQNFPGTSVEALPAGSVGAADVVVLATTSAMPVASPPCWGAGLVVSLGADTDAQSELDPAWSRYADVYCDTLDSLRFGDLRAWVEAGEIDASAVTGLLECLRRPLPEARRPRIFVSTGSALFDSLTVYYLFEREALR